MRVGPAMDQQRIGQIIGVGCEGRRSRIEGCHRVELRMPKAPQKLFYNVTFERSYRDDSGRVAEHSYLRSQ